MSKTKKQSKKTQTKSSSKTSLKGGSKLTWLPKKTFELEFSVPWNKVEETYKKVLDALTKDVKLEGFRQGKAPKDLVEKSVDKGKLYGEVVNQVLPVTYAKAIADHKLKPAVPPQVKIIAAEEKKPWQFKATSCELPEVKLGDYKKIVKGALAKDKIWTPEKGKADEKQPELTDTQKMNLILKAMIEGIKIEIPDLLVKSETDRLLSRLLDQVQKLGLTIEQYAQSNGKTVEILRKEQALTAENTLKMELIMQAVATEKNFKADDKDIDAMINASGDEKIKKQLNTPSERAYISSVVRKRKAIDYLLGL